MGKIRKENKSTKQRENNQEPKGKTAIRPKEIELEIVDKELLDIYPKENFSIWRINVWNKSDVTNKVRTVYLSVSAEEGLEDILINNEKAFLRVFEVLVSISYGDYLYVGDISKRKDTIVATTPNSIKAVHWIDRVKRCMKEDIKQQKDRKIGIKGKTIKTKKEKMR